MKQETSGQHTRQLEGAPSPECPAGQGDASGRPGTDPHAARGTRHTAHGTRHTAGLAAHRARRLHQNTCRPLPGPTSLVQLPERGTLANPGTKPGHQTQAPNLLLPERGTLTNSGTKPGHQTRSCPRGQRGDTGTRGRLCSPQPGGHSHPHPKSTPGTFVPLP